jgi:tetratricopeptide (TPR) repeat protein
LADELGLGADFQEMGIRLLFCRCFTAAPAHLLDFAKVPIYDFFVTARTRMTAVLSLVVWAVLSRTAQSQARSGSTSPSAAAEKAVGLAAAGHCAEAIPELRKAVRSVSNSDLKKLAGLHGLRCSMIRNQPLDAQGFLLILLGDFPRDPEVLYQATHVYADLSTRASQDLMREAPFSYHAHELIAETLEQQGKWDQAAAEYRKILEMNSALPGIHFRLGRALLSKPDPTPEQVQEAKRDFELELKIDPQNAGAEGVLGEIAATAGDTAGAIDHYRRATTLDSGFAEAYVGLGSALVAEKRYAEAVPALETAVKLSPDDPTAHYNLATALSRVGRKEEADREFAIHRKMQEANPPTPAPGAATPNPAVPN